MDCPACAQHTISTREWLSGLNAIVWTCPQCNASLRISTRVVAALIGYAAAGLLVAGLGIYLRLSGALTSSEGDVFVLGGLAVVTVISVPVVYGVARSGPYRVE